MFGAATGYISVKVLNGIELFAVHFTFNSPAILGCVIRSQILTV